MFRMLLVSDKNLDSENLQESNIEKLMATILTNKEDSLLRLNIDFHTQPSHNPTSKSSGLVGQFITRERQKLRLIPNTKTN